MGESTPFQNACNPQQQTGGYVYTAFKDWFHLHYQLLKDFSAPSVAFVGLVLTAIVAIAGFRSFGRWKREKIEERRIEVALDALAIAYEAKFRFEIIRSRLFLDGEAEEIDQKFGEKTYEAISHREAQKSPYAVLKRLRRNNGFFERVNAIEPRFMAIFGSDTTKIFQCIYRAQIMVGTAAQALYDEGRIDHDPTDTDSKQRARQWRSDVYASPGKIEPYDNVGQKVLEFQSGIEKLCRPIVDATFGRRRKT
jgi:hypothetical protein